MIEIDTLSNSSSQSNSKKSILNKLPLKFKGMIIKSLFQKYKTKEQNNLRTFFYKWYVKQNHKVLSRAIDMFLIGENTGKFSSSSFFYKMKFFIRSQIAQKNKESKNEDESLNKVNKTKQLNQQSSQQIFGQSDLTLQIKKTTFNQDNLSKYFQSLKHIFSMKLISQVPKLPQTNKQFQHDFDEPYLKQTANNNQKYKKNKYKTEGCQINCSDQEKQDQRSFKYDKVFFVDEDDQCKKERDQQSKEREVKFMKIKQLGFKVSINLLRTFFVQRNKVCLLEAFHQLKEISFSNKQVSHQNQASLKHIPLHLPPSNNSQLLQIPYSSYSTILSLPDSQCLNNQITHISYQLSLLQKTIKKDQQIKQLYNQLQKQYNQFQSIQKDFSVFKYKIKNSIFQRIRVVKNKVERYWRREGFRVIKEQAMERKRERERLVYKEYKKEGSQYLSKSRVNIKTLHQIFSKPLIIPHEKNHENQSNYHEQQNQKITSIRLLNQTNTKSMKSQYLLQNERQTKSMKRRGIKKQTVLIFARNQQGNQQVNYNSKDQQKQNIKTMRQNGFKKIDYYHQRQVSTPIGSINKIQFQSSKNMKSFVKFKMPSPKGSQQSKQVSLSQISKQSSQISIKQQQYYKQKNSPKSKAKYYQINKQKQLQNSQKQQKQDTKYELNKFYDISIKSFQSQQESISTKKYHSEIKSQYWWTDCIKDNKLLNQVDESDLNNTVNRK